MLTTKIVVRLLTADGALLGWAEVCAEARGDGGLWTPSPTVLPFDQSGRAAVLSLHLADFNVEHRKPIDMETVAGGSVTLPGPGQIVKLGDPPVGLPPVTVRGPVAVTLPVGHLGAAAR